MAAISKLTSRFKNAISHASAKYYASFEKNLHVNMAFQEPMIILGGGGGGLGDLHAGMQANKIITVFPDEGIFASVLYFFLYFYLSKIILFFGWV